MKKNKIFYVTSAMMFSFGLVFNSVSCELTEEDLILMENSPQYIEENENKKQPIVVFYDVVDENGEYNEYYYNISDIKSFSERIDDVAARMEVFDNESIPLTEGVNFYSELCGFTRAISARVMDNFNYCDDITGIFSDIFESVNEEEKNVKSLQLLIKSAKNSVRSSDLENDVSNDDALLNILNLTGSNTLVINNMFESIRNGLFQGVLSAVEYLMAIISEPSNEDILFSEPNFCDEEECNYEEQVNENINEENDNPLEFWEITAQNITWIDPINTLQVLSNDVSLPDMQTITSGEQLKNFFDSIVLPVLNGDLNIESVLRSIVLVDSIFNKIEITDYINNFIIGNGESNFFQSARDALKSGIQKYRSYLSSSKLKNKKYSECIKLVYEESGEFLFTHINIVADFLQNSLTFNQIYGNNFQGLFS